MWWQAIQQVFGSDVEHYGLPCLLPLLGAVLGASVGSIRRWYWSRWQLGFVVGWCLGSQIGLLLACFGARVLPDIPDYDQLLIMTIAAMVIGMAVSLVSEFLLRIPFSPLWERFRDAPWRWLASWPIAVLAILVVCSLPLLWLGFRWEQIAEVEQRARLEPLVNDLNRQWERYQVHFDYNPGGYWVAISSPQALEDPVIQEFDRLPGPINCFAVLDRSSGDDALRRMVPRLQSVQTVSLHDMQVTTDSFKILDQLPRLNHVEFVNCPQLTKEDMLRYQREHPHFEVHLHSVEYSAHFRPKKP
jgi:hypothetical protein